MEVRELKKKNVLSSIGARAPPKLKKMFSGKKWIHFPNSFGLFQWKKSDYDVKLNW